MDLKSSPNPMEGWIVRLIDKREWADSDAPKLLRRLGAKIVYHDAPKTTHLVTAHAATATTRPGWMPPAVFDEFRHAVNALEDRGANYVCWTHAQLHDAIAQGWETRRRDRAQRRDAAYTTLLETAGPVPRSGL